MIITMLRTARGTEDGFSIQQFFQGKTYDIRDNLACSFLQRGFAKLANIETKQECTS